MLSLKKDEVLPEGACVFACPTLPSLSGCKIIYITQISTLYSCYFIINIYHKLAYNEYVITKFKMRETLPTVYYLYVGPNT